ncbi:MAG TPA: response regulator [Planctomycetota bacterium]|nr:response regulator [Planctomycetota bacterium]
MRILLAEDSPTDRMILMRLLAEAGHETTEAADGDAAFEAYRQGSFECVVTDWVMPGLDGVELTRRIRGMPVDRHVYVVMVTAKEGRRDHRAAIEAGVDDFISKPVDPDELRARLRTADRFHAVHDQLRRNFSEKLSLCNSLDRQDRRYRDFFARSPDPTALLDAGGRFVELNLAWSRAFGYAPDALQGKALADLAIDDDRAACERFLAAAEGDASPQDVVLRLRAAGGDVREVSVGGAALAAAAGLPRRLMLRALDLTERRLRDAAVREREKLASMGALLAGVAGEIGNPLALVRSNLVALSKYLERTSAHGAIVDAATAAAGRGEADEARRLAGDADAARKTLKIDFIRGDLPALVKRTTGSLDRVLSLVADVRDFAAIDRDAAGEADVVEAMKSAVNIVAVKVRVNAELVSDYGPAPRIRGNHAHLAQAFVNVLVNAAEAIRERGFIKVRTWEEDGRAYASVEDDGRGISPDHLGRVFEPFFTTKPLGTGAGLGLNMTFNIVQAHDGRVRIHSTPGRGTTVTFDFPALPQTGAPVVAESVGAAVRSA